MAAKYPKKPKLLKYRRKPKPTASLSTHEKWLHHVKETDAKNKAKITDWAKAKKQVDQDRKRHEQLKKQVAGVGAIDYRNMWMRPHTKRRKSSSVGSVGKKRKTVKRKPAKSAKRKTTRRR